MGEKLNSPEIEETISEELLRIVENYFPDDGEFFAQFIDEDDLLGAIYGALLEQGEDPDLVLVEYGVTETDGE